jgi:3',5'-cyclic AMP phosphodiesterase CpdA
MHAGWRRRDFLTLMGVGGVVVASGLGGCTSPGTASTPRTPPVGPPNEDFFFLQLTDTHWGFTGAPNPTADVTLEHAIATINSVETQPEFIVFTGDLTHITDDTAVRKARMARFKELVSALKVKDIRFLPGEHDASPDHGEAYREAFGDLHYSFDHKGVHFIALDNVSEAGNVLGASQLEWLAGDLARVPRDARVVVFAHRPLFDLYPEWDWATKDGARAIELLSGRPPGLVTVFYGHIHQEHHQTTGSITHHSARSLIFPLPAPGSAPKRAPLPWDPASKDHGLGWRAVTTSVADLRLVEELYR